MVDVKLCPLSMMGSQPIACYEWKCHFWRLAKNGEEFCALSYALDMYAFKHSFNWFKRRKLFKQQQEQQEVEIDG